jgi:hypothetical protein
MAVYHLFRNRAFEPEAISTMTRAYGDVCRALGLSERDHPQADVVAKAVIEFAQRGERDPVRLRESVLRVLRG